MSSDHDSDYEGSVDWQTELQSHRLEITKRVDYRKISPWLKNYWIFDQEDDEEVSNPTLNPTEESRMNRVVDKMLRKGEENYAKFLKILMYTYADLYTSVTKKEVPERQKLEGEVKPLEQSIPSISVETKEEVLTILFERLEAKNLECEQVSRQTVITKRDLEDRTREVSQLQSQTQELKRRAERYEGMERDMAALKDVMDQVKNENYKICMRLVDINEENSRLRERNMAMRIEIDMKDSDLKKMKNTVDSERRQSHRYRTRIENGPSPRVVAALNQQINELKLQLARSKRSPVTVDDADTRIQMLQADKDEALQMCADASEKLNQLRDEYNTAESLRDKYLEENERLRLQVSALTDDCDMHKTRRDAVWQQLQEVEKERDQLMKERNEAQMTAQNHMDEKTKYRSEIRQLEEKLDERSLQLREKDVEMRDLLAKFQKQTPSLPVEVKKGTSTHLSEGTRTATESLASTDNTLWRCTRLRVFNIKRYPQFVAKSEFEGTMAAKHHRIGPEGEFPEIPLAKNYGNGCGNLGGDYPKARKQAVRKKDRRGSFTPLYPRSGVQSRTSSTDSEGISKA